MISDKWKITVQQYYKQKKRLSIKQNIIFNLINEHFTWHFLLEKRSRHSKLQHFSLTDSRLSCTLLDTVLYSTTQLKQTQPHTNTRLGRMIPKQNITATSHRTCMIFLEQNILNDWQNTFKSTQHGCPKEFQRNAGETKANKPKIIH